MKYLLSLLLTVFICSKPLAAHADYALSIGQIIKLLIAYAQGPDCIPENIPPACRAALTEVQQAKLEVTLCELRCSTEREMTSQCSKEYGALERATLEADAICDPDGQSGIDFSDWGCVIKRY